MGHKLVWTALLARRIEIMNTVHHPLYLVSVLCLWELDFGWRVQGSQTSAPTKKPLRSTRPLYWAWVFTSYTLSSTHGRLVQGWIWIWSYSQITLIYSRYRKLCGSGNYLLDGKLLYQTLLVRTSFSISRLVPMKMVCRIYFAPKDAIRNSIILNK